MLIKRGHLIFLIVFVGILVALAAFLFLRTAADDGKYSGSDYSDIRESELEDIAGPKKSGSGAGGAGSSGGSGGGGGTGGVFGAGAVISESPPEEELGQCDQQVSFSTSNFNYQEQCNEFDQEICVSKIVICNVDVGNLDEETSGTFEVSFVFYEEEGQITGPIQTDLVENDLLPGQVMTFTQEIILQSQGVDGYANKNIVCAYSVVKVPKKSC